MASTSGPPAFRLGTYGGREDGADVDTGQQGLGAVLPPVDSPYVPKDRNFSPQIKVNLKYPKASGARGSRWIATPRMASASGPPAFRLGTYDRVWEDGADVDTGQRGLGDELTPMESRYVREDRNHAPLIKVKLPMRTGASQLDLNRFDRDRLFSAAARGVPEDLAGLLEYLRTTSKYLTDSEYTEGSTGKTCLMKAVLNLRDGANACILPLLRIDRDSGNPRPLVNAQCTDEYYRGHSALHIAIEKRSLQCVRLLVENGADVHARACGRFFQRKTQGTCFYFGELPLSLAACTNQWDVVDYLLKNQRQPASLQEADSLGNTVLHALVMIADNSAENSALVTHMYDRLLQAGASLCPSLRLEDIPNRQGLTPLKLAAQEGKMEIFRHILQREFSRPYECLSRKFTEWCYGPVRVSLYDMASVDSCEENSVLEIIAFHCRSPHRHQMVVLEPLNKLLQAKWDLLRPRFFFNFLCFLTYMLIFTAVVYCEPALEKAFLPMKGTVGNSLQLLGHILILLGGGYLLLGQLWCFWRRRLFIWISFLDSYFDLLFLFQALLTVLSQVLHFLAIEWYLPLLVSSLVLGWLNLLYYTRGFQSTGIYSVMIQKVILRDLLRFLLVYVVFLFGFAIALVSLSQEVRDPKVPASSNATEAAWSGAGQEDGEGSEVPYRGIVDTALELFKFTIGMGELAFQEQLRFRGAVLLLLLAYVLLTYILLLNMLIALMNETVSSVTTDSWSIWKLQVPLEAPLSLPKDWPRSRSRALGGLAFVGVSIIHYFLQGLL
ncbi:transient receptor potential cation channel subfamily V member 2-like isoform X2 [Myotis daubentonii]|uniref:transient receptor potential cation channel subfamily V member 2-like isoform X2 n=1 Tax=Myotis daubentonii TaxID=98922 RepID=UPI00287320F8|nr:transient receptor potential cation channel subfamily V member 2-like isoform X2 [Myotis daubentonii]